MYDWRKPLNIVMKKVYAYDIAYIQMLIFNVLQMPLSIYANIETIKNKMYLQALILMIFLQILCTNSLPVLHVDILV